MLCAVSFCTHDKYLHFLSTFVFHFPTVLGYRLIGTASSYLAEMRTSVDQHCNLRSATHGDLLVPTTTTRTYKPHSFAVSEPCVWNNLPPTSRASAGTLGQLPKANSAFYPSGVGKWSAGKAKAGMVQSVGGCTRGVQVKL